MDRSIQYYDRSGYMTLMRLVNYNDGRNENENNNSFTHYYNEDSFKWSYLHIPNTELWDYWVNDVEDKSYNEIIEVHLNKRPSPIYDINPAVWDYSTTLYTKSDFFENKLYNDFNWLTILRDPVERIISEYYFIYNTFYLRRTEVAFRVWSHLSEEERLDLIKYIQSPYTYNGQIKFIMGKGFLNDYIVTEEDYDRLIERMEELDFKVGIMEKLEDSLSYFNNSFGFNMGINQMTHERKNNNKPYVSEEIREEIEKHNKLDIKLYNYFLEKLNSVV